jgi:hypothetical protein
MLLCLANIGSSMANFFRFLYARVCCGYCNYVKKRNIRLKAATLSSVAANHANAISYAAMATTNLIIQQNSHSAGEAVANEGYNTNSPPSPALVNDGSVNEKKPKIPDIRLSANSTDAASGIIRPPSAAANDVNILELLEENTEVDYRKITVPISITLFILSSYIFLGGVLFQTLENWTILDGVYFCFITLR